MQNQAQSVGRAINSSQPAPLPEIVNLVAGIDSALNQISAAHERICAAADRIVMPPPTGVGDESKISPAPQHLDARLRSTLARAEELSKWLHSVADRLDGAV